MLTRRSWRAAGVLAALVIAAVSIVAAAQSALTTPFQLMNPPPMHPRQDTKLSDQPSIWPHVPTLT